MKMNNSCPVASFVNERIQVIGKSQIDIASECGFEKPNIITMIKQGKSKLPLAKVGAMAIALETDPVHLLKLTFSTYYQETWSAIAPYFEVALTELELQLINTMRSQAGASYLHATSNVSKEKYNAFIQSLIDDEKLTDTMAGD